MAEAGKGLGALLVPASIPLLLLGLWEGVSRAGLSDAVYTPAPSAVIAALAGSIRSGELLIHTSASLQRMALGLAIALITALPLGLAVGRSEALRVWLRPTLEVLRQVPPLALIPVTILWLGIDLAGKTFIVAYACFWPIFYNAALGAEGVSPILLRAARVMELSRLATFVKVTLPAALPSVFVGVRISVAIALVTLLVAEMVGATDGLGFLVIYSQRNFDTAKMLGVVATIGVLGTCINEAVRWLERQALRHRSELL